MKWLALLGSWHRSIRGARARSFGNKRRAKGPSRRFHGAPPVLPVLVPQPAAAWKPFTHIYTGDQARADAIDNDRVTIGGGEYAVRSEIVAALRQWRQYYNAGVV